VGVRRDAGAGLVAVVLGVAVVLALEFNALRELTPRRTISHHGLGADGWIFTSAIALLAAGSLAIAVSLVRSRLAGLTGLLAMAAWSAGLMVVAFFPKNDWSVGPSLSGSIHRVGTVVAFISLPLAALVIARPWRHRGLALIPFGFGVVSALWFVGIGVTVILGQDSGLPWWRLMPLGVVQRGLAATETAAVVALGLWALRATAAPHGEPPRAAAGSDREAPPAPYGEPPRATAGSDREASPVPYGEPPRATAGSDCEASPVPYGEAPRATAGRYGEASTAGPYGETGASGGGEGPLRHRPMPEQAQ
jgi:hypothetical protein